MEKLGTLPAAMKSASGDGAMLGELIGNVSQQGQQNINDVGGIDLNPNQLKIQTEGKGMTPAAGISAETFESLKDVPVDGFSPVIINISPVINLPLLILGSSLDERIEEARKPQLSQL